MTSGGSSIPRRNSSTSTPLAASIDFPAAVDEHEPGATLGQLAGRRPGRDDRAKPVAGQHDPVAGCLEQAGALSDRDDVPREGRGVVAVGRGIGQAVAAQVHGDHVTNGAQPAGHRRPRPRRVRQAVDEQDAGRPWIAWSAPIEEVDPVAGLDDDHEPLGFGPGIRRRHGLHRP